MRILFVLLCMGGTLFVSKWSHASKPNLGKWRCPDTLFFSKNKPKTGSRRLILVSVDGLRPDGIRRAGASNLLTLACSGRFTWKAQTISPSVTLPSHASMLSGLLPETHGILSNRDFFGSRSKRWRRNRYSILAAATQSGLRTVAIVGKEKLLALFPKSTVSELSINLGGDSALGKETLGRMKSKFDFMFLHLPSVDITGHAYGWMSPAQLRQIKETDRIIGRIIRASPAGTRIIVTADHGGTDMGHGDAVPSNQLIPWLMAGPGIVPGVQIETAVSTMDTAATIYDFFRIKPQHREKIVGRSLLNWGRTTQ